MCSHHWLNCTCSSQVWLPSLYYAHLSQWIHVAADYVVLFKLFLLTFLGCFSLSCDYSLMHTHTHTSTHARTHTHTPHTHTTHTTHTHNTHTHTHTPHTTHTTHMHARTHTHTHTHAHTHTHTHTQTNHGDSTPPPWSSTTNRSPHR